jgi:septum formation protein
MNPFMEWILASASPRRRQLLQQIGHAVRVWPANVDESPRPGEAAPELVRRLARTKAEAVAAAMAQMQERGSAPILGADTGVVLAGEILNKPADPAEAAAMLERLSGQMHEVWTGLCVLRPGLVAAEAAEMTRVWFAPLSAAEIAAYVSSGEPLDKAGAYGIQGPAAQYIPRIEGSYSNVMGLPLHRLRELLA